MAETLNEVLLYANMNAKVTVFSLKIESVARTSLHTN